MKMESTQSSIAQGLCKVSCTILFLYSTYTIVFLNDFLETCFDKKLKDIKIKR